MSNSIHFRHFSRFFGWHFYQKRYERIEDRNEFVKTIKKNTIARSVVYRLCGFNIVRNIVFRVSEYAESACGRRSRKQRKGK